MKGGCIHHDHGPLGAASYDRAEERKIELLKSAGYNALRTAHNPPAPALLDACDRLGFLVIDETFDAWISAKVTNDYHLYFHEWWQRDTEAMVKRDRNHPSVIMWSIGNEIFEALGDPTGAEWSQRQAELRALPRQHPLCHFRDHVQLPGRHRAAATWPDRSNSNRSPKTRSKTAGAGRPRISSAPGCGRL